MVKTISITGGLFFLGLFIVYLFGVFYSSGFDSSLWEEGTRVVCNIFAGLWIFALIVFNIVREVK